MTPPHPDDDALQRLLDRDEIRQLAQRYAVALDARDLDALVELFVEDVQVGRDAFGRAALRRDFDRQLRAIGVSVLFVGNHVIDFDGPDAANGVVYCKAEIQEGDCWNHQAIQYHDSYARRDGHWRFVRRKHLLWYGQIQPSNPLDQSPADWPKHSTGRGTLPEALESWRKFWDEGGD
ncbi:MAG: nuclear transport factor 2 family protein [Deltaproteobacteria bacterium]|nr:nuclear transport factor 2 family protein [Deltaproteobacteria bacterium]MBW2362335.1 nuclear transport factor 2 family protein [Deltaproteobacteria bacterium]